MAALTKFALNNGRLVLLFVLFVVITGPISFVSHPSREDPEITIRTAVVTARYPGMSPERVENLITRKLEEKLREIPEIEHINSTSRTGLATVKADVYERHFGMERIWQNLRNKMQDVTPDLPEGTAGPFVDDDYGNVAMATVALTGDGFSLAEMRETARRLRDRLYAVQGTRKIELFGVEPERIFVEINTARLAQLGLSSNAIIDTLQKQNIVLPGGNIQAGPISLTIEPTGNFESVADIESVTLQIPNKRGQVAYLRDIAHIRRAYVDPPSAPAFFNGKPAVVLSISMVEEFDAFKFGEDLKAKIAVLQNGLPIGYELSYVTFQPNEIAASVYGVSSSLLQTIAIVLAVVMLFLGWRLGLIVGAMVPLTMLLAILFMRQVGIQLERMSLATLIISLGLLVDNGIVVAEEILRRLSLGEERRAAAIATGRELALPLLSSTLTTVLAFMPLMLAESSAGEYTRSISLVIAITLIGSWVLAMTVTPLLCVTFASDPKPGKTQGAYDTRFYNIYRGTLAGAIQRPAIFLSGVALLLMVSVWGFQFVPKIFFPSSERTQLQLIVDRPIGSNSTATIETVANLNKWLLDKKKNPEIASTIAYVASGGPRFYLSLNPVDPDPHRAYMIINTVDSKSVPVLIARIASYGLTNVPEARLQTKPLSLGPAEAGLVEYRVSGPGANELKRIANLITAGMRTISGTRNIQDDWENRWVKIVVHVDQARARRVGVSSEDIARSLNAILSGQVVTNYREGDTSIPVVIRAEHAQRTNLDRLRTLTIPTANDGTVPLLQIATFDAGPEFSLIQRRDLQRTITVSGKHATLTAVELHAAMQGVLSKLDLKPGYAIEVGGEIEDSQKAQGSLFKYMPLALALIVLILVGQFGSYRKTAIVLTVIPLSIAGITAGLLLAPGSVFSFMAMLGMLSLAGIIINNAIVLIDRIDTERAEGLGLHDAIIAACMKRARPILMTTVTTVLGLSPLILWRDILFYDLAVVIAGGLAIGTLLTLAVVPVLYALFFRETRASAPGAGMKKKAA